MSLRRRRPGLVYPTWEDWRYVGDTGEPAMGGSWDNAAGDRNLAFRVREIGIVDIQGYIENLDAPLNPSITIFTLPAGYRPSVETFQGSATASSSGGVTTGYAPIPLNIDEVGTVSLLFTDMTFQFGAGAYIQYVYIQGQFFLTPASAP